MQITLCEGDWVQRRLSDLGFLPRPSFLLFLCMLDATRCCLRVCAVLLYLLVCRFLYLRQRQPRAFVKVLLYSTCFLLHLLSGIMLHLGLVSGLLLPLLSQLNHLELGLHLLALRGGLARPHHQV